MASLRPKSETIQSNSALLSVGLAGWSEGGRRQIEAARDPERVVNAVEPLDPPRRLFEIEALLLRLLFTHLHVGGDAIRVMRLVVQDDDVFECGERAEHAAQRTPCRFRLPFLTTLRVVSLSGISVCQFSTRIAT